MLFNHRMSHGGSRALRIDLLILSEFKLVSGLLLPEFEAIVRLNCMGKLCEEHEHPLKVARMVEQLLEISPL